MNTFLNLDGTKTLEQLTLTIIYLYLDLTHNNLTKTAKILGISRQTVYNILKRHENEVLDEK
jgi:DNA-binding NtrC family response regulator